MSEDERYYVVKRTDDEMLQCLSTSIYDDEVFFNIFDRMAKGELISHIVKDEGYPSIVRVYERIKKYPDMAKAFERAREMQAIVFADEIIDIADDSDEDHSIDPETGKVSVNNEHIQRSRLRVSARQWLCAKYLPAVYGEKSEQTINGSIVMKKVDGPPQETRDQWLARQADRLKALGYGIDAKPEATQEAKEAEEIDVDDTTLPVLQNSSDTGEEDPEGGLSSEV